MSETDTRAWMITKTPNDGSPATRWPTNVRSDVEFYRQPADKIAFHLVGDAPHYTPGYVDATYSVQALVLAPPEDGRPTYAELVQALRFYGEECEDGNDRDEHGCLGKRARDLLSRIPAEDR